RPLRNRLPSPDPGDGGARRAGRTPGRLAAQRPGLRRAHRPQPARARARRRARLAARAAAAGARGRAREGRTRCLTGGGREWELILLSSLIVRSAWAYWPAFLSPGAPRHERPA